MRSVFAVLAVIGVAQASDKHFTMFKKNKWYISDDGPDIKSHSSSSVEIDYKHAHFENHGVLAYFDSVEIEEGKTYVTSGTWQSKGRDSRGDCSSKYWTESKYDHACVDDGEIVDGCREYVECPCNTGDFRIVIADSNGSKVTKDGYESLDEISEKWNGFHIRVMPHVTKDFKRRSLIFPNTIWMKNKDETKSPGMFDHSGSRQQVVEMRDQADKGGFGLKNGGKTDYEFKIKKTSSRKFEFSMKLNGHTYDTTYDFPSSSLVPKKLDTFAVTMPNLRDYEYLKLHESSNEAEEMEINSDDFNVTNDIVTFLQ